MYPSFSHIGSYRPSYSSVYPPNVMHHGYTGSFGYGETIPGPSSATAAAGAAPAMPMGASSATAAAPASQESRNIHKSETSSPIVEVPDSESESEEHEPAHHHHQHHHHHHHHDRAQAYPIQHNIVARASNPAATATVVVIIDSGYGSIYRMAQAVSSGVRLVRGCNVQLYRLPELNTNATSANASNTGNSSSGGGSGGSGNNSHTTGGGSGAAESPHGSGPPTGTVADENIPVLGLNRLAILEKADAIVLGFSPSFGILPAELKAFMEWWGEQWLKGTLKGKVGGVFTAANAQLAGQELAIGSTLLSLLHYGIAVVGIPEIQHGMPYGAVCSTMAEGKGPSPHELEAARAQGKHIANVALQLARGRVEEGAIIK